MAENSLKMTKKQDPMFVFPEDEKNESGDEGGGVQEGYGKSMVPCLSFLYIK